MVHYILFQVDNGSKLLSAPVFEATVAWCFIRHQKSLGECDWLPSVDSQDFVFFFVKGCPTLAVCICSDADSCGEVELQFVMPQFARLTRFARANCGMPTLIYNSPISRDAGTGGQGGGAAAPPTPAKFNIRPMGVAWKEST